MQQLLIWRHAKASRWTPECDDFARDLRPVGEECARRVSQWILEHVEAPECILCSPSHRTRATLAPLLSLQPRLGAVTHFVPPLYLASHRTLESSLDAAFAEFDRVMVVGHNPGLETLVGEVIHRRHYDTFQRLPTGTLAVIDLETGWPEGRGRGRLSHLER